MEELFKKPLVLIVDDVSKNLQVLGSILYDAGYEIAMADNGVSALDTLKEIKPDIILLDIMMPEMDGYEVCIKIKELQEFQNVPIIFLTAKSEAENIVKGFNYGAADYVTKPFNSQELLARVKTHVELKLSKELLEKLNSKLEDKVNERTLQLAEANAKLAKLDHAKSYFLGLLSHELNTPITGILGSVDLLKADANSNDELELLDYISESTNRLRKFSEEALLIMRLRTDKYDMQMQEDDIISLISEILMSYEEKDPAVVGRFEKLCFSEELLVNIDYGLVRKCFDIIINNALKHGTESSLISIKVSKTDKYVVVEVIDNGPGFTEDIIDNAFNFFVSDEILHHKDGYGLGLAITELIMNAHSGSITLGNNEKNGAFVKLQFPL